MVDAVSNTVKTHPNLIEVTVRRHCSESLSMGVVKGVLQKTDVRKVDVMDSFYLDHHSKSTDGMSCECEYLYVCV